MADYTRWYRVGSVALTHNSKTVTGTGTFWLAATLNAGDLFTVDASQFYEIDTITSNTSLTLKTAFTGDSTTESEYSIIRNFTASLPAQTAARCADLLNDFRRYVDTDMQSIHGKSAYQIACDKGYVGTESEWIASLKGDSAYDVAVANGYSGTESEWLESLKAAGEWDNAQVDIAALKATTDIINESAINPSTRNSIFRGKNLGVFTEEHLAAIKNGKFTGMWLGDYFQFPNDINLYRIAGINYVLREGLVSMYSFEPQRNLLIVPDYPISNWTSHSYPRTLCYNAPAGTWGEDDLGTEDKCYPESNWYTRYRPTYIERMAEYFLGADNLVNMPMQVVSNIDHSTRKATASAILTSKVHVLKVDMVGGWHHFQTSYHLPFNTSIWQKLYLYPQFPLFRVSPRYVWIPDVATDGYLTADVVGWGAQSDWAGTASYMVQGTCAGMFSPTSWGNSTCVRPWFVLA